MVSLNIKNEATRELAERLARLTGESLTAAVTRALRERIEAPDSLAEELLAIGRDCARHLKEPERSLDRADMQSASSPLRSIGILIMPTRPAGLGRRDPVDSRPRHPCQAATVLSVEKPVSASKPFSRP